MNMKHYVRITFKPHGAKRRRTTWAIKVREEGDTVTYLACNKEGDTDKNMGLDPTGVPIERREFIVATKREVDERAARMNNHYAELELD